MPQGGAGMERRSTLLLTRVGHTISLCYFVITAIATNTQNRKAVV